MLAPSRLATLSYLLMESLVWYALASVLAGAGGGTGPLYLTVLLSILGGFLLTRGLQRFELSPVAVVGVGAGVTILALTILLNVQYNAGGSVLSLGWLTGFAGSPDGFLQSRWPQ